MLTMHGGIFRYEPINRCKEKGSGRPMSSSPNDTSFPYKSKMEGEIMGLKGACVITNQKVEKGKGEREGGVDRTSVSQIILDKEITSVIRKRKKIKNSVIV